MEAVAAVAGLALMAGAVWKRRQLGTERAVMALLVAIALGIYASGLLSQLPDAKTVIDDVARALGPWTYALVGALAFLETGAFVGLVAPGETVVIGGGVIAGQGEIEIVPLIGLVWLCAILGDTTSFYIGKRLGRGFLLRHGPKLKIDEERLDQVEGYFQRHGGKTILVGRFIGLVRALAPFVAGSSRLPYRRFIPYSIAGTGLWATCFSLLGYVFWRSFDTVEKVAGKATLAFGITVGLIAAGFYAYRRLRKREERRRLAAWIRRQERRPYLKPLYVVGRPLFRYVARPFARLAEPRIRFVAHRLTPGDLGLELTTVLAAAAVGTYVFVLYTGLLSGEPSSTPADRELLDLADDLRSQLPVDIAKVVTALGSLATVGTLVLITAVVLAARREWIYLTTLVVGTGLVYLGVQLAKAGIDRPRPSRPLVETRGQSFPSGHAAYSTAYVALGVIASRVFEGLASKATLVVGSIALAAAVGLSRVYLRTHYWSDVAGGWGLGVGVFAACAGIALVVAHFGQNERTAGPADERPAAADSR